MTELQAQALNLLRIDRRRSLYEGADARDLSRGSGEYFVDYTLGGGPMLTRADIDALLKEGLIQEKRPGTYELTRAGRVSP